MGSEKTSNRPGSILESVRLPNGIAGAVCSHKRMRRARDISSVINGELSRWDILPVGLLLLAIALFAWKGTVGKSNTTDELVHLLAGHAAWQLDDYRLNPENGALSSRVAALPLQFMEGIPRIEVSGRDWSYSQQWNLGRDWLFNSGADHEQILRNSHLAMLIFNLAGIALVFLTSTRLWGRGGGYLSLMLVGFSPNFLGHLPLATSDIAGAWTLFLAVLSYAWFLEKGSLASILAAGLTAGLAVLAKHSGVLIFPAAVLLLGWRVLDSRPLEGFPGKSPHRLQGRLEKLGRLLPGSIVSAFICVLMIWFAFGLRFAAANPEAGDFVQFQMPWEAVSGSSFSPLIGMLRGWHLLPEAYLYGLDFIFAHNERGGFLDGSYATDGFPFYHVWTFLYKTPLPTMVLLFLGMGCLGKFLWKTRSLLNNTIFRSALAIFLVYGLMLASSSISIGYRHAFPLLMVVMVLSGVSLPWSFRHHVGYRVAVSILALSLVPLAWSQIERTIAYTNILGGGAKRGYQHLADSSLDWGQDLPSAVTAIQAYQRENPGQPVHLSYFGSASPAAFGLQDTAYLHSWGSWKRTAYLPALEPGLYVITASALVTTQTAWTLQHESGYQNLSKATAPLYAKLEDAKACDIRKAANILTEEETRIVEDFEFLRAQRLKTYLRPRAPDEIIHGTVLLFHLDGEELIPFETTTIEE